MAADAGIFQQYMQPVRSVADYRGDMDRQEQNALQLAAGRMQAQQAQRAMADDEAYRAAAQETGGDQNALVKALMGRGLVKQAQAVQTGMLETEAKRGTIAKDKTATDAAKYDLEQKKRAAAATGLANLKSPQEAVADLQAKIQAGEVTPEQGDALLKTIPQDPVEFTKWQLGTLRSLLTPQQQIEMTTAKPVEVNDGQTKFFRDMNPNSPTYGKVVDGSKVQLQASPEAVMTDARTRSEGAANRGVTLRGQNLSDARARDANTIKAGEKKATDDLTKGGQLASFDTMLGTLDRLGKHPGLSNSVGIRGAFPTMPGSDSANFQAELNTFQSQAFIPMVAQLKGMGALSDAEGKKLTQAVGALDAKMGEAAFRESIARITADMESAYARVAGKPRQGGASGDFGKPVANIDQLLEKYK